VARQVDIVVSRTGWSNELGYELFLRDGSRGDELCQRLTDVGQPLGLGWFVDLDMETEFTGKAALRRIRATLRSEAVSRTTDSWIIQLAACTSSGDSGRQVA